MLGCAGMPPGLLSHTLLLPQVTGEELQQRQSPSYTLQIYGYIPTVYLMADNRTISSEPVLTTKPTIN